MEIIDDKGRIFGKINVIDFLVILFLLCIMPMFYFGYKIMTKRPASLTEVPKKEFVEIETLCQFIKLTPEIAKIISIGDKELNENGELVGEIISLDKAESCTYEFKIGEKEKIIKKDTGLKQLNAKLKLKLEVKEDKPYYKSSEIKVGLPLEFKTDEYTIQAVIPKVEIVEKKIVEVVEERIIDLFVTLKDLDEEVVKFVSVGDKELDHNGKIITEILSLGKIEDSSVELDLGSSNFIIGEDSNKKQISTKIRLKCQVKNKNQLYFKNKRIERNTPFKFRTDKYTVTAIVTKTFEVISPIKEKWISLQVKFTGVVPEIARAIQKGDIEKDAFEKTVARINSIISNEPSQVLSLRKDEFIALNHPFNKDILGSLDVLCIEKGGVYYFKDCPVKMGNNIVFVTDLYSITGLLIGMEIK